MSRCSLRCFWRGEVRTPVRGHTTGIAQSTQLYLSQLVRSLGNTPAESRTILFTDSRGRAGRAGQAFSYALTVCRDRSHDDYYFKNPMRMTGDVPPQPFLDLRRPRITQPVIAAELLRRAFLKVDQPPEWTPKSIHGTFGPTTGWPGYQAAISDWLRRSPEISLVVRRLTAFTGLDEGQVSELERWARADLVAAIDGKIALWATEEGELSELLATAGALPMFGFPTRARNLYDRKVCHPLWRRDEEHLTDWQRHVRDTVTASTGVHAVELSDLYEMDRQPLAVLRHLT
jgi:hypothetical protein